MTRKVSLLAGTAVLAVVAAMSGCAKRAAWKPYEVSGRETSAWTGGTTTVPTETQAATTANTTRSTQRPTQPTAAPHQTEPLQKMERREEYEVDLDGDGRMERVVLYNAEDVPITVMVNDAVWVCSDEPYFYILFHAVFQDFDNDGRKEILTNFIVGGSGNTQVQYVLKWEEGKLTQLPLPYVNRHTSFALEFQLLKKDRLRIRCDETGFDQAYQLAEFCAAELYNEEGRLISDIETDYVTEINLVALEDGRTGLELSQLIWGGCHANTLCHFVSVVTWENDELQVIRQWIEADYVYGARPIK